MTKQELIHKIDCGSDIMFDTAGKHYTILTWTDEGIFIDRQYPFDGNAQYFQTAKELVEQYLIDGIPLENYAEEVRITFYA